MGGPERALWKLLRSSRLSSLKFRRQHAIGPYAVDFACVSQSLVIELDGHSHDLDEQRAFDEQRTAFLEQAGWRVLRIRDAEMLSDPSGVCAAILKACSVEG